MIRTAKRMLWLALLGAAPAFGAWTLDNNASRLSFISIKASDIAEVHRFTGMSGSVNGDGSAVVSIDLASVDTLIPIRDERMREMLFQIGAFPKATLTTRIDPDLAASLDDGESAIVTAEVLVELHGEAAPIIMEIALTRISSTKMLVASARPVIVNAGTFNLTEGVEQLREVAGLPVISKAVPVSFQLVFVEN